VTALELDPFDAGLAIGARGLLRDFNAAGVLAAADVHVALRLAALGEEDDELVMLAAALAVRASRLGHVYVDLATVRGTAIVEAEEAIDLGALDWPPVGAWTERVAASPLVAVGEEAAGPSRPLRLLDTSLYLDRYWREERQVAADLLALAESGSGPFDSAALDAALARLYPGEADTRQRLATACAVRHRFAVVAGGPGTGKTTTVARIMALLAEGAETAGGRPPLVALAAPTAKAAARLGEAVHEEARRLDVSEAVRTQLLDAQASTLHRLLGWRPGSHSRFRHHRGNRLPHDVVIVDETSMVSLSMMARLVEAVRPEARLVLVGDPGQLASIEAGAVLGDIVGPAAEEGEAAAPPGAAASPAAEAAPPSGPLAGGIVVLDRIHRFGGAIAAVAEAVRRGDADAALEALGSAPGEVTWLPVDIAATPDALAPIHELAVASARRVIDAARAGEARAALDALGAFRVLGAHRRGPASVAMWTDRIEAWLAADVEGFAAEGRWYVGRPLLVTENDYGLGLYNGDTGVIVAGASGAVRAAFERRGEIVELSPSRLSAVETVHAMTIHKSQGSQFDAAAVLLPEPGSKILTRELLYTAVTRARERLVLAGTEEAVRAAIARPVARASGLRRRLWKEAK
jgi:exodeoxyribonuclease V alpha subunit